MAEDSPGSGQQDPSDSVGKFNQIAFAIGQAIAKVSTVKVVKVMAVDSGAKTVDVQIAVNQLDGQDNSTPHGTINGVSYVWAMGGKNAFQVDPSVGDLGVMLVCDRDISAVRAAKDIANPGSNRKFSPSDGIYLFGVPGMNSSQPEQWVKWSDDGVEIHAKHGNSLTSGVAGWKFVGNVIVENNLQLAGSIQSDTGGLYPGNIHIAGTVTADTDVVAAGKSGATHTHGGVQTGGGTSGPPT
jgi:hypothetical protein